MSTEEPSNFFNKKIFSNHSSRVITEERKPYLIAEIGLNHNKNMELAARMIDKAAECGADAVKFQSYTTKYFINKEMPNTGPLYNIFQQYELTEDEHDDLKGFAEEAGLDFISTPLTLDWVKLLADLRAPFYKIASGDINNYALIKETVRYKLPHFVSTGNSSWEDIERCAAFFKVLGFKDVVFLHCVSLYPAPLEQALLNTVNDIRSVIGSLAGFSDHTEGELAAFGAVLNGATIIEKHFTIDKTLEGPDHSMSADPDELSKVREMIDLAADMRGSRTVPLPEEEKGDYLGKRSIHNIDGKFIPMRPRINNLPKDSDYFSIL